jgi:hypothetical protein
MRIRTGLLAASIILGGCAGLKLTTAGEKVRVLAPDEVESCRELGKTNTSVTSVLMGVPRPDQVVAKELRIVARNSAARMGGDTIVALTVVDQGQQTFVIYKCINPGG